MGKHLYKKNSGFVEKTIGDELVIVPLVNAVAQMEKVFALNELGAYIYSLIDTPKSKDEILNSIIDEFEIGKKTALLDLECFLNDAVERKIVQKL